MGRKGPEISPEVRKLAVDLHQNGHRLCEISKLLQLSYMTVSNIVKRFYKVDLWRTRQEVTDQKL